jgi:nucleotide-binding universal stress UspA family protein
MHRYRILVPVSLGSPSDLALKHAGILAQKSNGMITCLHVIEHPGVKQANFQTREIERKIRRQVELQLASKVTTVLEGIDDISFELIVTSGKVHQKVLEKAVELDVDLIVMGRSDSNDREHQLIGKNAKKVLERSMVPVLTVTPDDMPPRECLNRYSPSHS